MPSDLATVAYPHPPTVAVSIAPAGERSAPLSHATAALLIILASLAAAYGLTVVAPDYFTLRGFPLDDAWIHAVYGRELARTGMWAYNPGIPATGSTSPLWSAVLAVAHLIASERAVTVLLIKWIGLALHVLTALAVYAAFPLKPELTSLRLLSAVLVALHPDLVSASVSGMEVPLATLVAVGLVWAAARGGATLFATLAAAAFLARPELALVAIVIPLVGVKRHASRLMVAAVLGIAIAAAGLGARNLAVSGMPLPATFYAKVRSPADPLTAWMLGFGSLLPQLPLAMPAIGLGLISLLAGYVRPWPGVPRIAIGAFVAGLAYCAVSFLLIVPNDTGAFYHQRYLLPVLPLLLASATAMVGAAVHARWPSAQPESSRRFGVARVAGSVLSALLAFSLVSAMPARYHHLTNDARNIDDVQVALGRVLADAAPTDVVWAVDAGAIRYFGNAFVVDLMALNTPALLGASATTYLDAHRPRYLEVVPLWAYLDADSEVTLPRIRFSPSTPYTVTGFAAMQTHELVRCDPGVAGEMTFRTGTRSFACAP